jgi:RNA polymerase sigma factor (sigma-70 family)
MPPPAEGFASRLLLGPALRTQPDRRLVTLVREGYEAAFEEIVRRYGKPLGRYAASIVGGRSEDVLQDAFAKALPALRREEAEIDLRPWLFRIVRNTALNELRDRPPSPELLAETLAGGRNPAEELERREELADLIKRLQALPEAQRAAIVMRELEGLGHDEIAAALGLSDGGARQAIYRARRALRDGLGLLLPLPLLRLLIDHGAEAATAGAGAGGALAAAGASAGGAGGAAKLGVVAVVLAGSVGAGVAVQDDRGGGDARAVEPARRGSAAIVASPTPPIATSTATAPTPAYKDSGSGERERERGDDRTGHGEGFSGPGAADRDRRGENRGEDRNEERRPPPRDTPAQSGGGHRGERGEAHSGGGPHRHGGNSGPGGGGRGETVGVPAHGGPSRESDRPDNQAPPPNRGSVPVPSPSVEPPEDDRTEHQDESEPAEEEVRDLDP